MKTINELVKALTLVLLCSFYLTGVLPSPWLVTAIIKSQCSLYQQFQGEAANSLRQQRKLSARGSWLAHPNELVRLERHLCGDRGS